MGLQDGLATTYSTERQGYGTREAHTFSAIRQHALSAPPVHRYPDR